MKTILMLNILFLGSLAIAGDNLTLSEAQLNHYVAAQEALAADKEADARKALKQLAGSAQGELAKLAEAAGATSSMAAMRTAFKPLSTAVMNTNLPGGHVLAFCPMAENNTGGHWIQKEGQIMNPYFGASMLHCGMVKKTSGEK